MIEEAPVIVLGLDTRLRLTVTYSRVLIMGQLVTIQHVEQIVTECSDPIQRLVREIRDDACAELQPPPRRDPYWQRFNQRERKRRWR